jgi:hypothetical protein
VRSKAVRTTHYRSSSQQACCPVSYVTSMYELHERHILTSYTNLKAQHWSTLIPVQKRSVPEIFIRSGGASGALFGVLGVFCMQYPNAGLGIMFIPVHFDAQYVLPAILLFDFIVTPPPPSSTASRKLTHQGHDPGIQFCQFRSRSKSIVAEHNKKFLISVGSFRRWYHWCGILSTRRENEDMEAFG